MTEHSGLGLRRLLANFSKTAGRQLWSGALQLAAVVLIARNYGPGGNGMYTVALLLPTLLSTLLGLGLAPANAYFLGARLYGAKAVYRTTMLVWLLMCLAGLCIGAIAIIAKANAYFPGVPPRVLWVALACFPPLLFVALIGSIFQGLQDFSSFNLSLSLQPALTLGGVALCVIFGLPEAWLVAAYLFGSLGAAAAMAVVLRRRLRLAGGDEKPYPLRVALSYGVKSHLGNIVAFLNYRIDLFLVNLLVNPVAAGLYGVAMQVSEKLWLVSQALSTVLLPRLSEVGRDRVQAVAITQIVSRVTIFVTLVISVIAAGVGLMAITAIFGAKFRGAYLPFVLLLPGIVAGSAVRILSSEIAARGRPEINLYMALIVVGVNIALNVLLVPKYGIQGAACATSLAYISNFLLRLVIFRNQTGSSIALVTLVKRADLKALAGLVRMRL